MEHRKCSLPDISVIVCSHNHDKWIERCIRSITHQEHIPSHTYEIILVDDGSHDDTDRVLSNLEFLPNLKIIKNEKNIGLPNSINRAIRLALGRYIIRVDSDDYISRHCLFLMKFFLDMNRKYQAVAADYVVVDEFENVIRKVNCFEEHIACGILFRKECLFDIGLYNEEYKMREGHELRKRFENKFKIARLEYPLYKYRDHRANRTKNISGVGVYDEKLNNAN